MPSTSRSFQGGAELPPPFMLTTVTPHVIIDVLLLYNKVRITERKSSGGQCGRKPKVSPAT